MLTFTQKTSKRERRANTSLLSVCVVTVALSKLGPKVGALRHGVYGVDAPGSASLSTMPVAPAGSRVPHTHTAYLQGEGYLEVKNRCCCLTMDSEHWCIASYWCGVLDVPNGGLADECPECRGIYQIGCCWCVYLCGTEDKWWVLSNELEVEDTDGIDPPSSAAAAAAAAFVGAAAPKLQQLARSDQEPVKV